MLEISERLEKSHYTDRPLLRNDDGEWCVLNESLQS